MINPVLRGFATINYFVDDLEAGERWYTKYLKTSAYFHVPFYTEFRVGDYEAEIGIVGTGPRLGTGHTTYFCVDNIQEAVSWAQECGAVVVEPITPRGTTGFITAVVADPWGNQIGLMENPHYQAKLKELKPKKKWWCFW